MHCVSSQLILTSYLVQAERFIALRRTTMRGAIDHISCSWRCLTNRSSRPFMLGSPWVRPDGVPYQLQTRPMTSSSAINVAVIERSTIQPETRFITLLRPTQQQQQLTDCSWPVCAAVDNMTAGPPIQSPSSADMLRNNKMVYAHKSTSRRYMTSIRPTAQQATDGDDR
jgi:hypothetical protein